MSRPGFVLLLVVLSAAQVRGADRSPAVRIQARLADNAPAEMEEALADFRQALKDGKVGRHVAETWAGAPPELSVFLTSRMAMSAPGSDLNRSGSYAVHALGVMGDLPPQQMSGRGIVWRQAAIDLARRVDAYAREQQHALLRKRPDWSDPGFDFEPLTKERANELGTKGGEAVVTEVRSAAALQVGDALLKVGSRKVEGADDLARLIYASAPGAVLELEVAQKGARRKVSLKLP